MFLPGWEEGVFPNQRALDDQGRAGLEEERRLAHVGLTRARRRAKIYFASNRRMHGLWNSNIPSRFLEEIPQQLLKWLTPRFSRRKAFPADFSRQTKTPFPRSSVRDVGGFRIGQNVLHPKFGNGVIIDAEGQGAEARVQVNFGNQGVKWLALAVAKLQAA